MKKITAILVSMLILLAALPLGAFAQSADDTREHIESVLNLANNADQAWTYSASADAWTLSVVSAVAYPELPDQQGVSVCVPGAYVTGIDTDKDGAADYGSQNNSAASVSYAKEGYIDIYCGKQDTATDADGNAYYTGDALSCSS